MIPLAHAGHWVVNLLYLGPVVLIVAMLAVSARRDKRAEAAERAAGGQAPGSAADEASGKPAG